MAIKTVTTEKAKMTDKQVVNLGREGNPFDKGTYVVFPPQVCHAKENPMPSTDYPTIAGLFAYVCDCDKQLVGDKTISRAQLTKQSFGTGDIIVKRQKNTAGNWFADKQANVSNIEGVKPKFGFVIDEDGDKCWCLMEAFAVKVEDSEIHNFPVLVKDDANKWHYEKDNNDTTLCLLRKTYTPKLISVSPTSVMETVKLPNEWSHFNLPEEVYASEAEYIKVTEEKEG
jgi:hypothetical protein